MVIENLIDMVSPQYNAPQFGSLIKDDHDRLRSSCVCKASAAF